MSAEESMQAKLENVYQQWFTSVDKNNQREGWGALCGGITILENLMSDYTLELSHHQTASGTQLQKAGSALGRKVLQRFGVVVTVRLGEFGRTSRGGPPAAGRLMLLLEPLHLESFSAVERRDLLLFLQELMVRDLLKLMDRSTQVIKTESSDTFEKTIGDLLAEIPKISSGAVAQHLVGAKLALRFPNLDIVNEVTSAADAPTNRPGDFLIGDVAFHVTLSPQDAVFEKCIENLNENYNVYLLIPDKVLELARRKALQYHIRDQIVIKSIESFVAQNIDEIAQFSKEVLKIQKENLVKIYNRRVKEANERYAPFLSIGEGEVKVESAVEEDDGLFSTAQNTYIVQKSLDDLS